MLCWIRSSEVPRGRQKRSEAAAVVDIPSSLQSKQLCSICFYVDTPCKILFRNELFQRKVRKLFNNFLIKEFQYSLQHKHKRGHHDLVGWDSTGSYLEESYQQEGGGKAQKQGRLCVLFCKPAVLTKETPGQVFIFGKPVWARLRPRTCAEAPKLSWS